MNSKNSNMKYRHHIKNAWDYRTPEEDVLEIKAGRCIQCEAKYTDSKDLVYTRLVSTGKIIWWHIFNTCSYKSKNRYYTKRHEKNKSI